MSENIFHNPNDLAQSLKNLEEYEASLSANSVIPLHGGIGKEMLPSDNLKDAIHVDVDISMGKPLYQALDGLKTYEDYKEAFRQYLNLNFDK